MAERELRKRLERLERRIFGLSFEEATARLQEMEEALKRLSPKEAERYLKANEKRFEMAERVVRSSFKDEEPLQRDEIRNDAL